jgi:hypothetical protein
MIIKLTDCEVELKDRITWGDMEQIQLALISGAKVSETGMSGFDMSSTLEAKYKLLEIVVVKITDKNGVTCSFSREWMNDLSPEDGDKLYSEADKLNKKKQN